MLNDSSQDTAIRAPDENEARLSALAENLPGGIVYQLSTSADGSHRRYLYLSRSYEALTGVPASEVLADSRIADDLILPEDRRTLVDAKAGALAALAPFDVQVRFRRRDGVIRWCRIISAPRVMADGSVIWDGIQLDTTTEKEAVEALRESEARFEAIANSIDQMVWSTRPDGFHDYYNDRWYEFTGVPKGSTDGEGWSGMFHPDDQERAWDVWRRSLETGEPYHIEYRLRHRSGDYRWVLGRAQPVRGPDGAIRRWFGTCTDIDQIVEAREILARSQHELEQEVERRTAERDRLWELTEDLLVVADYDGHLIRVSPSWTRRLGYESEALLSMSYQAIIHPDDQLAVREALERMRASGAPVQLQDRARAADGSYRWVAWTLSPDPDGQRFTGAGRDVTESKAATEALALSEARLRTIFATSYQYQGLLAVDGTLIDANATSLKGIGARLEDVVGMPFWETPWFTGTPGMSAAVREAIPAAAGGETLRREIHVYLPEGGWRWFDFTLRPLRDEHGHVVAIVPEAMETTERRLAEEALLQSQKLEAMGQLTGGVAHDFNNLLTPIIGGLDALHRRGVGEERDRRLIDGALQSAERAKTLVQRLLAFARRQPLKTAAVDVGVMIDSLAELIASTCGPRVKVQIDVPDGLAPALADQNQLEMALLNLSVNARDAMADGGTLTIAAAGREITSAGSLRPGSYVLLSVSDTGVGMDDATAKKAIEPFFSTKGIGKGTGLGLSMVHGLASQLGGELRLSSRPGLGTRIELWLPASDSGEAPAPHAAGLPDVPKSAGTALIVDDEELVRTSTADMLADLGFEVVQATSAREGLDLLAGGLAVDVLVTDHLMPGMTGADFARTVRERWPETRILLISGYAEEDGIAPDLLCLTKPFRRNELAEALARPS